MTSWITVIWSANAGICLTLAAVQLLVWVKSRDSWANLAFAIAAAAAVFNAVFELALMRAQTPEQFGELLRWYHVPLGVLVVSLIWFVRLYLRAGRLWLAWLVTGLRVVVLALTFSLDPNLNFREITGLNPISIWGETIVVAIGEKNPWTNITHASGILFLVFAVDAAFSAWRQGERRRAAVVGVTFGTAIVVALVLSEMLNRGTLPVPFTLSFLFLIILMGIAYELGMDVVRASQLPHELRESQERMRRATSAGHIGVWDWDIANDEFWVSDNVRERRGLSKSERINLDRFFQWVYDDDREHIRRTMGAALESTAGNFEVEYRAIGASGATRWFSAQGQVERASNGQPLRVRGVSTDITDRKLAEQSLQQSAEFKQQILSSLDHEIAILNPSGTIIDVNDAWKAFAQANGGGADWVGVSYLGVCLAAAGSGDPTALGAFEGVRSVLDGTRESFEMEYLCRSRGKDRFFLMRAVPLRTSDGGAVVSHVEMTQLKLAELEKQALRGELAHMSRVFTMGQLSTALAHELNQPLGAILRNAEAGELFLQRDPPDYEELKSILADIRRDDQRAAAVIDRMRSQLRRHESAYELLSVGQLLGQVIALAHSECQARHVVAHVDVRDDLPLVRGDRVQLQQVMLNLVMNALDAMDDMPVDRRRFVVTAHRAGERSVEVAVSDAGHGIPAGHEARVFEPFHTTKAEGLGMGLAISRTIIESHGGRIRAERNPDGGATFRITLNAVESKAIA